ncbi:MAG: site-2 protease family protein [Candidatus Marsarchaeota archaeon]|jgi:membrane-associated protease RseP (regulator of RpoE activity)|nr:site-2 protease family protein [Candidatus Marsarchaeota archaeon]MCL5418324.1 site-2 protease family protein [Candidatus Marsarchaeota archaeon]
MNGRKGIALALVVLGIALIVFAAYASWLGVAYQAAVAIVAMVAIGIAMKSTLKLHGGYGFYMIGGKSGIGAIDRISKNHPKLWEAFATWGLTMGLGILTYFILKGRIDKRVFVLGIASAVLIFIFVLPYTYMGLSFINVPQLQSEVAARSQQPISYIYSYIILAILAIAGFAGYVISVIIYSAGLILARLAHILYSFSIGVPAAQGFQNLISALPIIPGIDLPLLAGLLSLAILLIIHEFSHGILARIFKVKLKSIGMLLFGIIPIGAFVEPDEKMVKKLSAQKQTSIFAAGISANFVATLAFFALTMLMVLALDHVLTYNVVITSTMAGYPANNIIAPGTIVYSWDGHIVNNTATLESAAAQDKPGSIVSLVTNKGAYKIKAIADPTNSSRGLIGVELALKPNTTTPIAKTTYFLYMLFALSMLLNFLVAVVNLLPIPGFDGWQIFNANIKSKKALNALAAVTLVAFVINFIPLVTFL